MEDSLLKKYKHVNFVLLSENSMEIAPFHFNQKGGMFSPSAERKVIRIDDGREVFNSVLIRAVELAD